MGFIYLLNSRTAWDIFFLFLHSIVTFSLWCSIVYLFLHLFIYSSPFYPKAIAISAAHNGKRRKSTFFTTSCGISYVHSSGQLIAFHVYTLHVRISSLASTWLKTYPDINLVSSLFPLSLPVPVVSSILIFLFRVIRWKNTKLKVTVLSE